MSVEDISTLNSTKVKNILSDEFPNLYRNASLTSGKAQKSFFRALGFSLSLLVFASILSVLNLASAGFAYLQVVVLLASLALTIYLSFNQPQKTWYGARALAESVKTVTWRFIMRAEPYNEKLEQSKRHFVANLEKILNDNTVLSKIIAFNTGDEITEKMNNIRSMPIAMRREFYARHRVENQLEWYRTKAILNDANSRNWYAALFVIQAVAIGFAISRIIYPASEYWPTDIFVTAASCCLAWLQTKRFQELAASYSLTAHDISLLKEKFADAKTELKFSAFVGDAENAFSREHTQWRARRDVD
jgi:hypothetical protein